MAIPVTALGADEINLGALATTEDELTTLADGVTDKISWPSDASQLFLLIKGGGAGAKITVKSRATATEGLSVEDLELTVDDDHLLQRINPIYRDANNDTELTAATADSVVGAFYLKG